MVDKIVIHYKNKKQPKVIKEGLAIYLLNNRQDLEMAFANIQSKEELKAIYNAVKISLQYALDSYDQAEEMEKNYKK